MILEENNGVPAWAKLAQIRGNAFFRVPINREERKLWRILPSAQPLQGCTIPGLSTTTAASARLWTSRAERATGRWTTRCRLWSIWSTGPARMPREKPATAWAFCCRSAISSLRKRLPPQALPWGPSGNTAWACFSSPRRSCSATRPKSSLRSSAKRKDFPSWAGVRCRCARSFWDRRPGTVCPASGRPLWASRPG